MITSGPAVEYHLNSLGITWYLDYGSDPRTAPPGKKKVAFIHHAPTSPRIPTATLTQYATGAPGSYWYIWGEPNRYSNYSPVDYVAELDYYVDAIKGADPTARIVGPSVLNWNFTCWGCAPFTQGSTWMAQFLTAYKDSHLGALPPIDVYSIDAYPLTWTQVPMTNWQVLRDDLIAYRTWMNANGLSGKPIWVTEVASHWAYSSWKYDFAKGHLTIGTGLDWEDDYLWAAMETYMYNLFDWLRDNGEARNIEKWFLFVAYTNIQEQVKTDGYAGIYLFEHGGVGAPLNRLGQLYREMTLGIR